MARSPRAGTAIHRTPYIPRASAHMRTSNGRVSDRCVSRRRASHGRASHERAPYKRVSHGNESHGRAPHGHTSQAGYTSRVYVLGAKSSAKSVTDPWGAMINRIAIGRIR
jgi:hypothetical protein